MPPESGSITIWILFCHAKQPSVLALAVQYESGTAAVASTLLLTFGLQQERLIENTFAESGLLMHTGHL